MLKQAIFSNCYNYRYSLSRLWDNNKETCLFIGLNPSTADACQDDPTIKKLIAYASQWNLGGFQICNLFALRTPNPDYLLKSKVPIGDLNQHYLEAAISNSSTQILMWGNHGNYHPQLENLVSTLESPLCFGLNKNGTPKHPLYLSKDLKPIVFQRS